MKAPVKYASGDRNVEIREVEEPRCGDSEVKLEIAYCGICGTDLHVLHDTFRNYPPVILGHEFSGTVVEVGRNVNHNATLGERVTGLGATAVTCGQCEYCRSGYFIFCSNRRGMGHGVNGAFTRYVVMRPDQLYRIPENFSLEEAAMSEPFAAVVQAVTEISRVRIGDAAVVNIGHEDLSEAIQEYTSGAGVDVAFECAGHPGSVRGCLESLRPMGRYTQGAICGQDIQFPIDQIFYKQLTMSGSVCYTARTWERMMRIYAEGRVRLNDLISIKLPISEWRTAFRLCDEKKAIKVLMYPEK